MRKDARNTWNCLKAFSLNIRGLNKSIKRRRLFRWLHLNRFDIIFCPRRDFAQKAKSRGGTLVTRAYIKGSTYS